MIFAQIFTIDNGNAVCLFSLVKKNIYSFIHSSWDTEQNIPGAGAEK